MCEENSTKEKAVNKNENVTNTVVHDQPKDETRITEQTEPSNGGKDYLALFPNSVGPGKGNHHHRSNTKKGGKKNRKKSKGMGIVESHEKSEKEKTSLEEESKLLLIFLH